MLRIAPSFIVIIILLVSCTQSNSNENQPANQPTFSIQPPIEEYIETAQTFELDNSNDTILISENGSFIALDDFTFEYADGKKAEEVIIEYKEYNDPSEIILSGIPMQMIEGKDTFDFQSAGMFDLRAFDKDRVELSISPDKPIRMGIRHTNTGKDYNLYRFDKEKGEWITQEDSLAVVEALPPTKPILQSESDSNNIVTISIKDFKSPLIAFDNSRFFLCQKERPKWDNKPVFWYDLLLKERGQSGYYQLLLNGVLDGDQIKEDLTVRVFSTPETYEDDLKKFEIRMRLYADLIIDEMNRLKTEADQIDQLNKDYKDSLQIAAIQNQRIQDSLRLLEFFGKTKMEEYQKENTAKYDVVRSFSINKTGIYNCDRFYQSPITQLNTYTITLKNQMINNYDPIYLASPSQNAVLSTCIAPGNRLNVGYSEYAYHLIVISGGKIFHKDLTNRPSENELNLLPINKEEFERIMRFSF